MDPSTPRPKISLSALSQLAAPTATVTPELKALGYVYDPISQKLIRGKTGLENTTDQLKLLQDYLGIQKTQNELSQANMPKFSGTQAESVADADSTLQNIQQLRKLIDRKDLDTGRSQNAKQALRGLLGTTIVPTTDAELQFDALASSVKATFLKAISGAAVSEQEVKRLSKFLPSITDTRQELKQKLDVLEQTISQNRRNLVQQATPSLAGTQSGGDEIDAFLNSIQ